MFRYQYSIFLFCVCLMMAFGCGQATSMAIDWQEIEEFIGTPIPTSTIDRQAEWERGIDDLVRIRLTFPVENLESFLTDLGFTIPLNKGLNRLNSADSSSSWWNVDTLTKFSVGSFNQNSKSGDIVVTETETGMIIIYLVVFEQ